MKPKLLLHTCCAPCSGFLVNKLSADYQVAVYYDNSNIYPESEFFKRKKEAQDFFDKEKIKFIAADYDHDSWLKLVKGLERELERGKRCWVCYENRLKNTAQYAKENGYDIFGTTLSISPHKDAKIINELGEKISQELGIEFLAGDFKKQDGFKKAMKFSGEHNFYQQNYCGCEFSLKNR